MTHQSLDLQNSLQRDLLQFVVTESETSSSATVVRIADTLEKMGVRNFSRWGPYLYKKIIAVNEKLAVSGALQKTWKEGYRRNWLNNAKILVLTERLAREFDAAGIKLVFVKGSSLLYTLYRSDIGLREMADIDALVAKSDLPAAEKIVRGMGFSLDESIKEYFHVRYLQKDAIAIELHWDLDIGLNPHIAEIALSTSRNIEGAMGSVNVLGAEMELLVLYLGLSRLLDELFSSVEDREEIIFYRCLFSLMEAGKIVTSHGASFDWQRFRDWVSQSRAGKKVDTFLLLSRKYSIPPFSDIGPKDLGGRLAERDVVIEASAENFMKAVISRQIALIMGNLWSEIGCPVKFIKHLYMAALIATFFHQRKFFWGIKRIRRLFRGGQ